MRTPSGLAALLIGSLLLSGCGGGGGDDAGGGGGGDDVTAPTPARSSTIAITSDDRKLLVVNRQNDSVSVIEVRDRKGGDVQHLVAEIKVGKEPRYIAVSPDDRRAFVSNAVDGTVSVIDLQRAKPALLGKPIEVGTEPRGIAVSPNGKYVFVANHTAGTVSVIRASSRRVINTVKTGGNPMAVAVSNDGDDDDRDEYVYVTRFFSEVIDGVKRPDGFNDAKEGVIDQFNVGDALEGRVNVVQLKIAPLADAGFAADRRQFCAKTRQVLQDQGEVVFFNSGVDNDQNGAADLANETFCPDPDSHDAGADGPIAKTPQGVYPNQLHAALIRANRLYVPNVGASPEPPVKFNVNVQALVSSVDLATTADRTINLNAQIKQERQPDDPNASLDRLFGNDLVAVDADVHGATFLLVSRGGNYVLRARRGADGLDIGAPDQVVRFQTGNLPSGVVMSYDGKRAYTNNDVNTSVTAIDLVNDQVLARDIHASEPPAPGTQKHRNIVGKLAFFTALGVPDDHDLNGDGQFDIALRDIDPLKFRNKASDNGWSSCASCHDDGHSDNVTWIFPTGPRQTVPLEGTFARGDLTDQRVLNWNGVRGSVTDFNNNSRGVQGGIGHATNVGGVDRTAEVFNHGPTQGISDALDAMTEWVANAARAPIMPDPVDGAALAAGRLVFENHCASCHGGTKWTKSRTSPLYANNPTFAANPLAANFFAVGRQPPLDPNLTTAGPQIRSVNVNGVDLNLLDVVGTFNKGGPLELRGAGALGGGVIDIAGDPNEGKDIARQSTQGFGALGGIGFNTPSLLGVAYHAPYLHDGSALDLPAVFHKHTLPDAAGQPTPNTIADLIPDAGDQANLLLFLNAIDEDTPPLRSDADLLIP